MKNELALSGEKIKEMVYPDLFENIGMIRGEYLIRECGKNILTKDCQDFLKKYLKNVCKIYQKQEVWYRFSELTVSEANSLVGTKEILPDNHPLFGIRGLRRSLQYLDEFEAEIKVINDAHNEYDNLAVFFPFVNDGKQLRKAFDILRKSGYSGKVGTMIELPSAYFDLDNILQTGIEKIVIGMNDLTSFVYAAVRDSQWHEMNSEIMMNIIEDIVERAKKYEVDVAVAGYLDENIINNLQEKGIKAIVHYSLIPQIYGRDIEFPNHLAEVKKFTKENIRNLGKKDD